MGEYSRFISLFAVVCTKTTPQTYQCASPVLVHFQAVAFCQFWFVPVCVCTCISEQIQYPQSVQARSFDGINNQLPSATLTPH